MSDDGWDGGTALMPLPAPLIPRAIGGLPYLADFARLADAISKTEMVPDTLRGRPDGVLAVMMAGFEVGVGPMQALQSINLIKGKPSISPELMRALVMQAGHQIIMEVSDDRATARCHRVGWPSDQWSEFSWTMEDAKRAGLVRGGDSPWTKYPRAMLAARVTSEACRNVFADVIAGLSYTPDEVAEFAPVPAGLSAPGEVTVSDQAPVLGVPVRVVPTKDDLSEAKAGLKDVLSLLGDLKPTCVAYIKECFGEAKGMSLEQTNEAQAIAAGWPGTAPFNAPAEDAPRREKSF
jgi:hypothetical protein